MRVARKQSKTDSILKYLIERANHPIQLSKISSDLGFNGKVVATIASRLASRGYVKKVRRGVYVYEEKAAVSKGEIEIVCVSLAKSVEKTLGRSLMKKLGIALPAQNCSTLEGLEGFVLRLRGAMGTRAADNLISVVIRSELPQKSGENLMRKLGI
ncbi:MAG: hypothetical protein ACE5QW_07880 [Thermoplasmata archaeon]